MKKIVYQFVVVFAVMCIGVNAWAAPPATDLQCNPLGCVNDTDIAAGAVTTAKIADGAVTDVKIAGPIAAAKIEKPANIKVVAKSGGDYTTITDALANINPTVDNPYIIKVMPGKYLENTITMKSYVRLEGAGREVTTLDLQGGSIEMNAITDNSITALTVKGGETIVNCNNCSKLTVSNNSIIGPGDFSGSGNGGVYAYNNNQDVVVAENLITGLINAIYSHGGISTVRNNIIKGNVDGIAGVSIPYILGNEIVENSGFGIYGTGGMGIIADNMFKNNGTGIRVSHTGVITENKITGNNDYGIITLAGISISNNRITDSGVSDIYNTNGPDPNIPLPNISLNVYNTFTGLPATGAYNVKTDGTPAPLQ